MIPRKMFPRYPFVRGRTPPTSVIQCKQLPKNVCESINSYGKQGKGHNILTASRPDFLSRRGKSVHRGVGDLVLLMGHNTFRMRQGGI